MAGPPEPFSKGRLALVFAGLSAVIIGLWLVLRTPEPAPAAEAEFPEAGPAVVARPEPQAPERPIAHYLASADAERGETFFRGRCAACHTIVPGGPHSIGPNLHGVMGQPVGARPGHEPSDALRQAGGRWDWETANRFLRSPRGFAPGTRMAFAGISDPQDRADVMLYMNREGGTLTPPVTGPAGAR